VDESRQTIVRHCCDTTMCKRLHCHKVHTGSCGATIHPSHTRSLATRDSVSAWFKTSYELTHNPARVHLPHHLFCLLIVTERHSLLSISIPEIYRKSVKRSQRAILAEERHVSWWPHRTPAVIVQICHLWYAKCRRLFINKGSVDSTQRWIAVGQIKRVVVIRGFLACARPTLVRHAPSQRQSSISIAIEQNKVTAAATHHVHSESLTFHP
jgi:hypothetical protein